jgi:hypothetical protein
VPIRRTRQVTETTETIETAKPRQLPTAGSPIRRTKVAEPEPTKEVKEIKEIKEVAPRSPVTRIRPENIIQPPIRRTRPETTVATTRSPSTIRTKTPEQPQPKSPRSPLSPKVTPKPSSNPASPSRRTKDAPINPNTGFYTVFNTELQPSNPYEETKPIAVDPNLKITLPKTRTKLEPIQSIAKYAAENVQQIQSVVDTQEARRKFVNLIEQNRLGYERSGVHNNFYKRRVANTRTTETAQDLENIAANLHLDVTAKKEALIDSIWKHLIDNYRDIVEWEYVPTYLGGKREVKPKQTNKATK